LDVGTSLHRGPRDIEEQLDRQRELDCRQDLPVQGLYKCIPFGDASLRDEMDDGSGLPPVVIASVSKEHHGAEGVVMHCDGFLPRYLLVMLSAGVQTPAGVQALVETRVIIMDSMHTTKGARDLYIVSALTKDGGRKPGAGFWVARNRVPYLVASLRELESHLSSQAKASGRVFKVDVVIVDDDSKGELQVTTGGFGTQCKE
jgi:hypothetical protein